MDLYGLRLQSETTQYKVGEKEMKAVIVTGGKQYTVAEGDVLYIEKLEPKRKHRAPDLRKAETSPLMYRAAAEGFFQETGTR